MWAARNCFKHPIGTIVARYRKTPEATTSLLPPEKVPEGRMRAAPKAYSPGGSIAAPSSRAAVCTSGITRS